MEIQDNRGYLAELQTNWRYLGAASLGLAAGYTLNNYLANLFIPELMREFGWTSAQIALLGLPVLLSVVCQPLAGRLADRIGVRPIALFGVIAGGVIYFILSRLGGSFAWFFGLIVVQIVLFASTTGPAVYSRLIAESFVKARGLAFGIAASMPSVAGAAVVPFLGSYIEREGWRAGYVLVAVCMVAASLVALLLIPRTGPARSAPDGSKDETDYRAIFANPAFWPLAGGIVLCSLTVFMQVTQMKVVLEGTGMAPAAATGLITVYALGVIAGRLGCGAALDRYPAHIVATLAMALPALGLTLMATGSPSVLVQGLAVVLIGLALGAETDVAGFLVMRYFPVGVYSAVLGLLLGALSGATALGSVILSATLHYAGGFTPFLLFAAVSSLFGSWLFFRLGRLSPSARPPAMEEAQAGVRA